MIQAPLGSQHSRDGLPASSCTHQGTAPPQLHQAPPGQAPAIVGIPKPEREHEGLSEQTPLPHALQGWAIWGLTPPGSRGERCHAGNVLPPAPAQLLPYLRRVYDGHDHVEQLAASQGLVWELQGCKSKAGLRRGLEGATSRALLSPGLQQGSTSAPALMRASLLVPEPEPSASVGHSRH